MRYILLPRGARRRSHDGAPLLQRSMQSLLHLRHEVSSRPALLFLQLAHLLVGFLQSLCAVERDPDACACTGSRCVRDIPMRGMRCVRVYMESRCMHALDPGACVRVIPVRACVGRRCVRVYMGSWCVRVWDPDACVRAIQSHAHQIPTQTIWHTGCILFDMIRAGMQDAPRRDAGCALQRDLLDPG